MFVVDYSPFKESNQQQKTKLFWQLK